MARFKLCPFVVFHDPPGLKVCPNAQIKPLSPIVGGCCLGRLTRPSGRLQAETVVVTWRWCRVCLVWICLVRHGWRVCRHILWFVIRWSGNELVNGYLIVEVTDRQRQNAPASFFHSFMQRQTTYQVEAGHSDPSDTPGRAHRYKSPEAGCGGYGRRRNDGRVRDGLGQRHIDFDGGRAICGIEEEVDLWPCAVVRAGIHLGRSRSRPRG